MTTQRRGVTPVCREETLANAVPPDLFPDSVEAPAAAHARFDPAALAPALGAFLVKDVFLLGAELWSAGEALRAIHRPKATATPA